jgi:hypothetical protein
LLPDIILEIAKASQLDETCFCLAKRTFKHSIDPQTKNIIKSAGYVVNYSGAATLLVHHQVIASMKQQSYKVSACFSAKNLVACSCTCKAGCHQGPERVMCVHILPVLYQITILLFEGMAEHIGVEFANAYKTFANTLTNKQKDEIKN